jgi:hypothetical protein
LTLAAANEARDWRIYADFAAGVDRAAAQAVRMRLLPVLTAAQIRG